MRLDFYHGTLTTAKVTTDFSPVRIRFESQGSTNGICDVQSVNRTGFFLVLQFQAVYKWVLATTAWRVLRLRMEERPPIRRVAANILNKQSTTADEGWSSSLGVGRGANNASP